jgi:hypothetical protein
MDPVDLSELPLDSVSPHGERDASRCEADLNRRRRPELLAWNEAINDANASARKRACVVAVPVEQGSNQSLPFETESTR